MERFVVIMAGGSGTRLWPLSKEERPKQFISIDNGECMLVQTINRVCRCVPASNCFIITNQSLMDLTREAVKDIIPYSNIIAEPQKKNTAACISYGAMLLGRRLGEGLLCFIPADGYVRDHQKYAEAIELAFTAAEAEEKLVVIGITPSYPAIAYGYIKTGGCASPENRLMKVIKFTEKPDYGAAKAMLEAGDHLWNGGIVAGRIGTITENIRTYLPEHYKNFTEALSHYGEENFNTYIADAYNKLQNISFDNGVLEKCSDINVVRAYFDWDDIGSIDTLSETLEKDEDGNSLKGDYVGIKTTNSVIYADGILITAIGLDNMIIAGTKEAVIVCPRGKAQEVKNLVEKLRHKGYEDFL
ncbi:MAG TPA: mannose-1-phosphate guanylyltransferase [Ruminiclostridium sp.]|nr:mannose-1-phosphate guanylyltransferase [Ruminiclostridium sp.]